jgi:predicted RNA methylase
MAHITLTPEVRAVLETCTFDGHEVRMPKMERKLYEEINKVLTNAGGEWKRGRQAHVFKEDPREKLGLVLDTGRSIDEQKLYQAFYTPSSLVNLVVDETRGGRLDGVRVLEPSAGAGAIADVLRDRGAEVVCVELNPEAVAVLRAKGHHVIEGDFLQQTVSDLGGPFDCVVMNPPFTRDQDILHVRQAYAMLNPGGNLGAIMSPGWTDVSRTATRTTFRNWVTNHEGRSITKIPEGTFKESGTNIRTVLLTLTKPAN